MLILSLLACRIEVGNQAQTQGPSEGPVELWVYTSMYQSVLDELDPMLAEELPGVQVKWFQSGSEKAARRSCICRTRGIAWCIGVVITRRGAFG